MEILLLVAIIFLARLCYKFEDSQRPKLKKAYGDSGENVIACELERLSDNYDIKHDVRYGKAQIDHMVIHGKTIFVIETKRWTGNTSGKKNDQKWRLEYGENEYWNRNPILQNEFHIDELRKVYHGYEFVNVVVFVSSGSIPRLKGVIRDRELYDYIVEYDI